MDLNRDGGGIAGARCGWGRREAFSYERRRVEKIAPLVRPEDIGVFRVAGRRGTTEPEPVALAYDIAVVADRLAAVPHTLPELEIGLVSVEAGAVVFLDRIGRKRALDGLKRRADRPRDRPVPFKRAVERRKERGLQGVVFERYDRRRIGLQAVFALEHAVGVRIVLPEIEEPVPVGVLHPYTHVRNAVIVGIDGDPTNLRSVKMQPMVHCGIIEFELSRIVSVNLVPLVERSAGGASDLGEIPARMVQHAFPALVVRAPLDGIDVRIVLIPGELCFHPRRFLGKPPQFSQRITGPAGIPLRETVMHDSRGRSTGPRLEMEKS